MTDSKFDYQRIADEVADNFKKMIPEIKFNKNGYEIRSDILKEAKDLLGQDFLYKWQGWELSAERSPQGQIITKVGMPEFPGIEKVIEAAEKMYEFVNNGSIRKSK